MGSDRLAQRAGGRAAPDARRGAAAVPVHAVQPLRAGARPRALGRVEAAGALAGYHLLPAVRADFLRRDGRLGEAAQAYREVLSLPCNEAERRFLTRRLREVSDAGAGPPRADQ